MKNPTARFNVLVDGTPMFHSAVNATDEAAAEMADVYRGINPNSEVTVEWTEDVWPFVVGEIYACRSIGDWNCIWQFVVVKRTAKFITIKDDYETKRVGVQVRDGVERCSPLGRYSFSPTLSADKVGPLKPVPVGVVSTQMIGASA